MANLISTWLDVIQNLPQFFNWETGKLIGVTKGQILYFIGEADGLVRSFLKPVYGSNLTLTNPYFQLFCRHSNKDHDFIIPSERLFVYNINTELFTVTMRDYSAESPGSTAQISSDDRRINTYVNLQDSWAVTDPSSSEMLLASNKAFDKLLYQIGDVLYIIKYGHEPLLVSLVAKYAAYLLLDRNYAAQSTELSAIAVNFKKEVDSTLKRLTDVTLGSQLQVSVELGRDTSPKPVYYDIDRFGHDNTTYLDDDHYPNHADFLRRTR